MDLQLPCGRTALIDDEDHERTLTAYFGNNMSWTGRICDSRWHSRVRKHTCYAVHSVVLGKLHRNVLLHRLILQAPVGSVIDHKNHNGLDNRRENIWLCTQLENGQNRKDRGAENGRKFCGVYCGGNYWYAMIKHKGKAIYVGCFPTDIEAARAWNEAAIRLRGESTYLNPV